MNRGYRLTAERISDYVAKQWANRHKHCYICHQASHRLVCKFCQHDSPLNHFPVPHYDLLKLPRVYEHLIPPYYQSLFALGEYDGIIKSLVNRLKFSNDTLAAQVLAQFFMTYVYRSMEQCEDIPEALIPIPLSNWRYMRRGYNQARVLAQSLSHQSDIAMYDCLIKHKHTKAQSMLNREQRLQNLDKAYRLNREIPFKHIALIDDVVTTGATINAACEAIVKDYPDLRISVWCCAIAKPPGSKSLDRTIPLPSFN